VGDLMNQSVIEGPQAEALINTITQRPNASISEIEQQLPILLEETAALY
jgi:hypothetical protein